jgi:hypothetical protein
MLGAGGMAGYWIRNAFPQFSDRMEVAGLVDIRETVLNESGDFLNLSPGARFSDMAEAFKNRSGFLHHRDTAMGT